MANQKSLNLLVFVLVAGALYINFNLGQGSVKRFQGHLYENTNSKFVQVTTMRWTDYLLTFMQISIRYFITAGIAFLIYYVILKRKVMYKKIQIRFPKNSDYRREIGYSFITILVFAGVPVLMLKNPDIIKYSKFYNHISDHGWLYFFLAFPLMFILHDTYFYWTHRLMHHKKLFRFFHVVHHQSTNPSPWTAYSFHPVEALIESGIVELFLFIMPVHPLHLFIFFFLMITYNVYGHLGYELFPRGFSKSRVGKWMVTSTNHNLHHQYFKGNYGLYFTFWDRAMGTIRKDYDERFEQVVNRVKANAA